MLINIALIRSRMKLDISRRKLIGTGSFGSNTIFLETILFHGRAFFINCPLNRDFALHKKEKKKLKTKIRDSEKLASIHEV